MSGNTPLFRSETNENEKDVTLRQGRAIGFRMYDQQAVEAHNVSFPIWGLYFALPCVDEQKRK